MENDSDIVQYHWQVSFHFTPSLRESEIIDVYDPIECENRAIEFKVIDEENRKRTQVIVDYKTNKIDEVLPDSKAKYEYAEETKARKYALFFQNLILERMIYQRAFKPVEIIRVSKPILLNEKELKDAGLMGKRRFGMSVLTAKYNILTVGDSIGESHNFWKQGISKEINGKAKDERMIYAIGELLHLAKIEAGEMATFILTWNAFNWMYAHFGTITNSKNRNDQSKMFKNIISKLMTQNDVDYIKQYMSSDLLNSLSSYNIILKGGTNVSQVLKYKMERSASDIEIIISVLECIYGVRNQIFHEGSSQEITSEELAMRAKICNSMLAPIVTTCLKNFINYES